MRTDDPFRHHPGLAGRITPPAESQLRGLNSEMIRPILEQHGVDASWLRSDAENDAERAAILAQRPGKDLWVFAYGSLIWDPAVYFDEVLRAYAPGWERAFILRDFAGGRGTPDQPGVMAALDRGEGCNGVVFRIAEERLEEESKIIWNRERLGPAYSPRFIDVETKLGMIRAVTFVADKGSLFVPAEMTHAEQVECCAKGRGFMGSSLEYVENLASHLQELGIDDPHLCAFLDEVHQYRAAMAG